MKLSDLKANPANPRIIKDEAFHKLVNSIKEFPKMMALRPMVVDNDMTVLGGNMRLRALQHLGYKEIPDEWVKKASELTEDEKRQFIIKDNIQAGLWDWDALANEWDEVELTEWGLELPPEWGQAEQGEAQEDDYEIPDEIETDIVLGDLFEIGQHRLLCGDSTDSDTVAKLMGGEKADMVLTDPPYNVDYQGGNGRKIQNDKQGDKEFNAFLLAFHKALINHTKDGGAWYVWHIDSEGLSFRKAFTDVGLYLTQCLVWVKNTMVLGRLDYQKKHESCLYGWKPGAAHYFTSDRTNTTVIEDEINPRKLKKEELLKIVEEMLSDKVPTTVLKADKPHRSTEHPTMKPILLLAPLIQNSSKPGWIVVDSFIGSGSTMVAAHQLNRKCYGVEIDPKYCQVIIDRMIKLDPNIQIKRNGKEYQKEEKNDLRGYRGIREGTHVSV